MIRTPTLFVLGAGASKPYGFPLGAELRTLICEAQLEGNVAAQQISHHLRIDPEEIRRVARVFFRSNERSIDSFLTRNPQYVDIGKALIAANLCAREEPDVLSAERNSDHWYRHLWNHMVDDTKAPPDLTLNEVRFLSFNYDRSLEYFLHESTKHTYDLDGERAHRIWSRFPIRHIYGSLGDLTVTNEEQGARHYSSDISARALRAATGGIHLIPEARDDADIFQTARKWFDWASCVFFLGFGFDRLNCERLRFPSVLEWKEARDKKLPFIVASTYGLTPAEIGRTQHLVCGNRTAIWQPHALTNTMTLRHSGLPQ